MLFEAMSKNTFITVVAKPTDVATRQNRSRSAESARNTPGVQQLEKLAQESLQSLTSVLQSGVLQPSPQAGIPASSVSSPSCSPSNSPQNPWYKHSRFNSSCSLSTMDLDSATASPRSNNSEYGELPTNRMRKVSSGGSLSSMVSSRWGTRQSSSIAEIDEGVEFELDIEAGAAAACEKAKVEQNAPAWSPTFNQGKVTSQMRHRQVPKNQNMAEIYMSSKGEAPTTLMIRNIPGKYTQDDLMQDLSDKNFAHTYDFLYLPMDKGTGAGVGYAFVNFIDNTVAAKFTKSFDGYRFSRQQRSSKKLAKISVAHLQGLEKNLQHYKNAAVNAPNEQRRRPVIIASISSMCE